MALSTAAPACSYARDGPENPGRTPDMEIEEAMSDALLVLLNPKFEKTIADALEPGEQALVKLSGAFKEALVCTDRRVMIVKMGMMTGNLFGNNVFQLPYEHISSVEVKFGLLSGYFEMSAGGMQNTMKSYWSQKKGSSPQTSPNCVSLNRILAGPFKEAVKFIMARKTQNHAAAASGSAGAIASAVPVATADDPVAMIERLGGLRDRGLLTEAEFESKKAEIMARI